MTVSDKRSTNQVLLTIVGDKMEADGVPVNISVDSPIMTTDGQVVRIPLEGSLGILAMGYAGIMLWRAERHAAQNNS